MIIIAIFAVFFYLLSMSRSRSIFIYMGFAAQVVYMLLRGIQLERIPLVGPHDTMFFLSSSIVAFAMPFTFSMKNRKRFLNPVIIVASFFAFFAFFARPHNAPLPPVLRTYWFELHVALSFFSYALFVIAAILGILFLLHKKESNTSLVNGGEGGSAIGLESNEFLPEKFEVLQYNAVFTGYCMFSLSMIFGGIWAYLAWGTYWLWTQKELWTTILWIFYSFYLHARFIKGWKGRPSAILGIIGFAITLFTYLGVSLLMKSSHTF